MSDASSSVMPPATGGELLLTRLFDAPRELVFRLWTDPVHAMRWWGPVEHPAVQMQIDLREGGRWRHCLRAVETGELLWQGGRFQEVKPPERLVFTFSWEEEGERGQETLVTVVFADEMGKTRMTFRQAPFVSNTERDGHSYGWTSTFGRLDGLLQDWGGT